MSPRHWLYSSTAARPWAPAGHPRDRLHSFCPLRMEPPRRKLAVEATVSMDRAFRSSLHLSQALLTQLTLSGAVAALPLEDTGDRQVTCPDVAIEDVEPANTEWGYWALAGALRRLEDRTWHPSIGVGSEVTWGVARYVGFPADGSPWAGRAEIRSGPWGTALLQGTHGILEGGLKLHIGGIYNPKWGTLDTRAGVGTGTRPGSRDPHATLTFLWGLRLVPGRTTYRSVCAPPTTPKAFAQSQVLRLFVTGRRLLVSDKGYQLAVGVELGPGLLFSACN